MRAVIVLLIVLFLFSGGVCQTVNFFRENLTFVLEDGMFSVSGEYFFSSSSLKPVRTILFYPVVDFEKSVSKKSIVVFDVKKERFVDIKKWDSRGFAFPLYIGAGDTAVYHIEYSQALASDTARYILTSTKMWKKPLKEAFYRLVVRDGIWVRSFSFEPDTMYEVGNARVYEWKRSFFMPKKDFIVIFSGR